jgi:hypothetical protein
MATEVFLDNIFKLHEILHLIVIDNDPTFTSNLWKELFGIRGTQLNLPLHITPKLMVRLKLSTSAWKHI